MDTTVPDWEGEEGTQRRGEGRKGRKDCGREGVRMERVEERGRLGKRELGEGHSVLYM